MWEQSRHASLTLHQSLDPKLGTEGKPVSGWFPDICDFPALHNALVEPQIEQHRVYVVYTLHKALQDACKFLQFEPVRRTAFCMQKLGRSFSLCAPEIICLVLLKPLVVVGQKMFLLTAWCLVLFSWWFVVAKIILIFFHYPLGVLSGHQWKTESREGREWEGPCKCEVHWEILSWWMGKWWHIKRDGEKQAPWYQTHGKKNHLLFNEGIRTCECFFSGYFNLFLILA